MKTPLSSMLLMLVASLFGSFGAACLKSGAERLQFNLVALIKNYYLAAGVGLYVLSSYFFVLGLRHGELSVLYPMVSLGYIWTLFLSRIFFGETFTKTKILGLAFVLFGIILLGAGNR
ncbi:MAG: EamA family transporter [Acidobacteriales bacterium]|nr:EamA family transporter [Terriglobales bacterium]